jgi:hypothetical protein
VLIGALPAALGVYLGARLGGRLGQRDARWYIWVPMIGLALAAPLQTAFVLWPESERLALGGLELPVGFLFSMVGAVIGSLFTAPVLAVTLALVKPGMRALAAALTTGTHSLVGHGAGPWIVGALSESLEPSFGTQSIRYALLFATLMPLASAAFFTLCVRPLRADLARARE